MAGFKIDLPDSLDKMLADLGDIDEVAPRMLKPAGPTAEAAIKKRLARHRRTSGLIESVKPGKPKKTKSGGWYLKVGFGGYGPDGHPNDVKAAGLEFGNSHQQPEPFLDAAAKDCEEAILDVMQAEYNLYLREKELIE